MFLQKTKTLEKEVERMMSKILRIGMVLNEAASAYFKNDFENFCNYVKESDRIESEVDHIRKDIELSMYSNMLIPESRGDVLKLLEALDEVVDCVEKIILEFDIERPVFPEEVIPEMLKVSELSSNCIEKLVQAVTAFFTARHESGTYIQQVKFFESEIDRYEEAIKRKVFSGGGVDRLSVKLQLKMFIEQLADISDYAEDACEHLTISSVKRSI